MGPIYALILCFGVASMPCKVITATDNLEHCEQWAALFNKNVREAPKTPESELTESDRIWRANAPKEYRLVQSCLKRIERPEWEPVR